jgi:hypothetical protein
MNPLEFKNKADNKSLFKKDELINKRISYLRQLGGSF